MKAALATSVVVVVASVVAACSSVQTLPYTPQPSRIANPFEEATTMIASNATGRCIVEPQISQTMLVVNVSCGRHGVGNSVVRFDRIEGIELQRVDGDYYRVVVHQRDARDFAWSSASKSDMERLADALTALSRPQDARREPPPPPPPATF